VGDICYHVINRGNSQAGVFQKDGDYRAFVELIGLDCHSYIQQQPRIHRIETTNDGLAVLHRPLPC
jgi:hypothetical protein